ncbi:uncharacterized protein LAESUDRAFT_757074 [Laetiporus sulphureus 93-53]|uniref:Uncharacterized protein n=1 Tax=Laetiporus sulphureus 93-53 TaxID=1314785 RepID=A0A165FFJ3_9APHY|nr:uncharacterized protein LAESUDRAFT_757074 [Laetiporus sulphureus 93-53]KZT08894.1 hypothetical protein LAESUDRAFT_757074 [Laetiporus sulphureus 93-53]
MSKDSTSKGPLPHHHSSTKKLYMWNGSSIYEGEKLPSPPKYMDGETSGAFFAHCAAYRAQYIFEFESPRQKLSQQNRENNAKQYQISTKGHNEIFKWLFDSESMKWKRNHLQCRECLSTWKMYNLACKRYDSVTQEWNVVYFLEYKPKLISMTEAYSMVETSDDEDDNLDWDHQPDQMFFSDDDFKLNPLPLNDQTYHYEDKDEDEIEAAPHEDEIEAAPYEDEIEAAPHEDEVEVEAAAPHEDEDKVPGTPQAGSEDGELPSDMQYLADDEQKISDVIDFCRQRLQSHWLLPV